MTLDRLLEQLAGALAARPATHPARVCFELAREHGATLAFAGADGEALGAEDLERWWREGGPDPFLDSEGRATLRVQASPRINDWAVLNVDFKPGRLEVVRRYTMVRSWVVDDMRGPDDEPTLA